MNYAGGKLVDLKVGNTERAARLASELAGGALFEIRAEHEYPYDYRECVEVSKEELTSGARPEAVVEKGLSVKGSAVESAGPAIEAWLKENGVI